MSELVFSMTDSLVEKQVTDTGAVYVHRTRAPEIQPNEIVMVELKDTEQVNGTVVVLYQSGAKLYSSQFQVGKQNGTQFYWYEDGQLMQHGRYDLGLKTGNHVHYYRSGLPNFLVTYDCNGEALLSVVYDTNGRCTEAIPR